jgi:ABC-type glycerol-3-phosphate transport system substrate-binding protein
VNGMRNRMTVGWVLLFCLLHAGIALGARVPITMWFSSQPQSVFDWVPEFQKAFNNANPDIDLSVETYQWVSQQRDKLIVNAAAGTAPDLFSDSSNVMGMWVDNGLARPLDTYLAKWADRSDLIPATIADLKYSGQTYAVPFSVQPFWDMYNLDVLEAAGAALPNTWDNMVSLAKKLTKVGSDGQPEVVGYSVANLNNLYSFIDFERCLEQLGTRSIEADTGKTDINSDAGRKALRYLADLVQAGMPNLQVGSFNRGNVGVMHWASTRELNDTINAFGGADKVNLSLQRYVGPEPGKDLTHYLSGVLFMVSTTQHPQEAWRAMEAWMRAQNLRDYLVAYGTNLPSRRSMLSYRELRTGPYADQMIRTMEGTIIPYGSRHFLFTTFRAPVGDILSQAIQSKMPIPTALEQAENTLRQIVADTGRK